MSFDFKYGKKPARAGAVKLRFGAYLDKKALRAAMAAHPKTFGHERLIAPNGWGMLGNDQWGCCLWSGAAHEQRMWNFEAAKSVVFTTTGVLSDYAAATGFKYTPDTDQGTDMQAGAKYRRDVGIVDEHGVRHKIEAYISIEPGDIEEHEMAAWLFGAAGIGLDVPQCFEDQFLAGKPWDISTAPGATKSQGGHYTPFVAVRDLLMLVTYGRIQPITLPAFRKWNDKSIAYLSEEMLTNGKSPEAFDYATLKADLALLTA